MYQYMIKQDKENKMSDLDGTLSAITLEHLNHPDGPQRVTITADGCTYFVRDTINVCGPRGPYSSTVWVKDRRMDRAVPGMRRVRSRVR